MRAAATLGAAFFALLAAAVPARSGAQPAPAPEEIRIGGHGAAEGLIERVLDHRGAIRPLEGRLTFRQLITTENLDREREVTASANALYRYVPVAGRHLWNLLEVDGEPITGSRFRREERRYRKAAEAARKEAEEDRAAAERNDPDYEVKPKNGMDLFYKIVADAIGLGMFEGELYQGASWRGRPMQVVRFRPRPGFRRAPNRIMSVVSGAEGELWVDPEAMQVARVRARLTRGASFLAGLFGRLYEGTAADVESEFTGDMWLPDVVTMSVNARVFFFRRIRRRVTYDFLAFRTLTAEERRDAGGAPPR